MFENRDEAIQHLTPNSAHSVPDASVLDASTYKTLLVAQLGCILHLSFVGSITDQTGELEDLSREFDHLASNVERGSRILLDFAGVESFDPSAIDTLVLLNKRLRNKGSRIVLCSVSRNAKKSFFATAPSRRNKGNAGKT